MELFTAILSYTAHRATTVAAAFDAAFPSQTGIWWVFSPLKHINTVTENFTSLELPWYYLPMWGELFLDLRVVGTSLAILTATLVVVPLIVRRVRKAPQAVLYISGILGMLFATIFVYHGFKLSTSWVNLAYIVVSAILIGMFIRITTRTNVDSSRYDGQNSTI